MPFFFFGQDKPPSAAEWELLGTTSRRDLADEVYDNCCRHESDQAAPKMALIEAANAEEARARLERFEKLKVPPGASPFLRLVNEISPRRLQAHGRSGTRR